MDTELRIGCSSMKWAFLMTPSSGSGCERSVGLRYDLPGPQVPQRQYRRAKHHQPISYRSPSDALVGLRHGHPAYKYLRDIPAWRRGLPTDLRHGHHAYKCLRDIPAWRRGLLSALWHGDPQLKHFWGRVAWRREGNRYRCRD